ncbi:uncharacterized protein LOC129592416 [Paramacrobiotus metropolitanus]|uniref:uncharacterized protein LOC129592416 n=1 Tax=Paramacrobiotus metropolitanus TaxID=2943436 RepID=UPI0024456E85|nr:uncharacterized protein LOC129592416 [Paramacrobiotus metropolitanus]
MADDTQSPLKSRRERWINKPWKSLTLLRPRSKDRSDAPSAAFRQVFWPSQEAVLVEQLPGKFTLGYACDVDTHTHRVMVDLRCHNTPPQWVPADTVWAHFPADREHLRPHTPALAALRRDSAAPRVFQPGVVLFAEPKCRAGLLYVETQADRHGPRLRRFVHPVHLRVVVPGADGRPRIPDLELLTQRLTGKSTWRFHHVAVGLEPGQHELLDLQLLLATVRKYRTVLRISVEEERVTFALKEWNSCEPLTETHLKTFVKGALRGYVDSPEPVRANRRAAVYPLEDKSSVGLGRLPYELQEDILMEIEDIHSVVNAQRVCRGWHEALTRNRRANHVAVDLNKTVTATGSRKPDEKYNLPHLVNLLDNSVNEATVSLTLIGDINPATELTVVHFLTARNIRLPLIILKKSSCWRPLTQNQPEQSLELANLSQLMRVCQTLRLQEVTFPGLFGPIAGLWCSPARVRTDVDVHVRRAEVDCMDSAEQRLVRFLHILNDNCPELSSGEWEVISAACDALAACAGHPFRSRLFLMLALLNDTRPCQPRALVHQPALSRLAAHAFRYSYPGEVPSSGRSQGRALPRAHSITFQTEGTWNIAVPQSRRTICMLPGLPSF